MTALGCTQFVPGNWQKSVKSFCSAICSCHLGWYHNES